MRHRKLTEEGRLKIEAVARARFALPTDKELALENDVSEGYIRQLMWQARRLLAKSQLLDNVCDVSCGTSNSHTPLIK